MGEQCHTVLCFSGHKVYEGGHCYCVDCREAVGNGEPEIWREEMKRMVSRKVYPIGYSAGGSQKRVEELMSDPYMLLIDTRFEPRGGREHWRQAALQEKYQSRYHWAGSYLGNVNYNNGLPIKLVNPVVGIRGLAMYLEEGHDLILLCTCLLYESCHRRVIVEKLLEVRPDVEIIQPPKPEPIVVLAQPALFEVPEERHWHDI